MAEEAAFQALTKALISDSFTSTTAPPRPGQPQLSLQRNGPFLSGLNQSNDELDCIALGNIRKELLLEIAWQRILSDDENDVEVTPLEMGLQRMVLSVAGFVFNVRYVSMSSLSGDVAAELRHWTRVSDYVEGSLGFRQVYEYVVAWAKERGVFGTGSALNETDISKLLMESWDMKSQTQTDSSEFDIRRALCDFFEHFCYQMDVRDAKNWSQSVREEAIKMMQQLDCNSTTTFGKEDPLQIMNSRYYIRISVQYHGNSHIECGVAMKKVERDLKAMNTRLQLVQNARFRLWPQALLNEYAPNEDVLPFEGFYLIGMDPTTTNVDAALSAVKLIINYWNTDPVPDLIVHAELLTSASMEEHILKRSEITWPRQVAVPGPEVKISFTVTPVETTHRKPPKATSHTTTDTSTTIPPPQTKLRPALDILHRLRHDPSYNIDDYIIGYRDRHVGILEKEARAWITENSDTEWIPQHKVLYFRRKGDGEKVWDRKKRIDEVFG